MPSYKKLLGKSWSALNGIAKMLIRIDVGQERKVSDIGQSIASNVKTLNTAHRGE